MNRRSEPRIALYSADVNATAEQVQKWATEDGYPGNVERCNRGAQITIGAHTFTDGDQWHIWKVGL